MAAQPSIAPVVGFNYSAEPTKKTWTRRYVALAFGPGHEDTIKQLFTRASELVEGHDIRFNAFSSHLNPRIAVKRKRDEMAQVLAGELGGAVQFAGIPSFALRLCRGVLTYQAHSADSTMVREELREAMKRRDHNADLRKLTDQTDPSSASTTSSVPLKTPQPELAPLTTPRSSGLPLNSPFTPAPVTFRRCSVPLPLPQPTAEFALADFEFNYFPPRIGKQTPSCKIRAEQLFAADFEATLQLKDFRIELLTTRLRIRNVISDLASQCLMYNTPEGIITLLIDEDLQNTVRYSQNHGCNSIKINVRTQDNTDQSTSLLFRYDLIRK